MSNVGENCPSANKRQKLGDSVSVNVEKVSDNNGHDEPPSIRERDTATVISKQETCSNSQDTVDILDKQSSCVLNNIIQENSWFTTGEQQRQTKLLAARKCWETSLDFDDDGLQLFQQPFRHGEIRDFVSNRDFVLGFQQLFSKIEFHEKASDLFQFNQSNDLNAVVDPHVFSINEYLKDKVLPFMKELTGLPLNQTIDMFLSIYRQTDFLLCHDDELDSRRIAFIWYLSEDWQEQYGGTLDLFSANDSFHPEKIQKKIVPVCNKFLFFEVGVTSFHQVSEILQEGKERLALSGWFYGEPLPRPKVEFEVDRSCNVLESVQDVNGVLKKFCAEMYLNPDVYPEINEQLAEESEVLVPGFLRDDTYETICKSIVDADVSKSVFCRFGPPNVASYEVAIKGPPISSDVSTTCDTEPTIDSLKELFYSKQFLEFLESITEFPFTTCDTNRVTSSLQKFSQGCFSLLKCGGSKQTGNKPLRDDIGEEAEEDPNLVDVMFFFANNWDDCRGGSLIYLTTEGEQLITVPPEGNCLAVVIRSPNVNSYTSYINCLAKDDVYFVYKMTFAFDGSI